LVFGKDGPDAKVQRGLESAAGFLRNALSRSLMIRYTPTLSLNGKEINYGGSCALVYLPKYS